MADTKTAVANKPIWVDLASDNPEASREFYAKVLGWQVEVNPDPQYGGYALAKANGGDVAGIGPKMAAEAPTAWSFYIGVNDANETVQKVESAGGKVIAPPMEVGDQGTMAVFQDPAGAFISVWQPKNMGGFQTGAANTFGWAELNARGFEKAEPFYQQVFGWTAKKSEMGEGQPPYTEFQLDGQSIAGGMEMPQQVPAQIPSYWLVYFIVENVDEGCKKATEAGGQQVMPPMDFPGGRFAVLTDPQGAAFGLLNMPQQSQQSQQSQQQ